MSLGPFNNPVNSFHRIVSSLTNQAIDDMSEEERLQYIYDRLYDEIARDLINREITVPEGGGIHVPGRYDRQGIQREAGETEETEGEGE